MGEISVFYVFYYNLEFVLSFKVSGFFFIPDRGQNVLGKSNCASKIRLILKENQKFGTG